MLEQRERQPVLVAVERAVRLSDHDGVEASVGVLEFGEQRGRARASLPWDRAGLVDVEELRDVQLGSAYELGPFAAFGLHQPQPSVSVRHSALDGPAGEYYRFGHHRLRRRVVRRSAQGWIDRRRLEM